MSYATFKSAPFSETQKALNAKLNLSMDVCARCISSHYWIRSGVVVNPLTFYVADPGSSPGEFHQQGEIRLKINPSNRKRVREEKRERVTDAIWSWKVVHKIQKYYYYYH